MPFVALAQVYPMPLFKLAQRSHLCKCQIFLGNKESNFEFTLELSLGRQADYWLWVRWYQGYLEQSVPWVVVFWCLAHSLELSLKDVLCATLFSSIDEGILPI